MVLHIKNMVCNRCKMVVRNEIEKLGLMPQQVELGEVTLPSELRAEELSALGNALSALGFEIIDNKKGRLIERIKNLIVELVHHKNGELRTNLSVYLSESTGHDYTYMTNLFSEVEGTTIEKYYIAQKIERVKELLVYGEMTLSEIAFQMNYSSVAHLSHQFKKVTGLTPSHFRNLRTAGRRPLDEV